MSMDMPKDPVMLLSFINMKLRDFYPSLEEFAKAANVSSEEISARLQEIDYVYDEILNQFV